MKKSLLLQALALSLTSTTAPAWAVTSPDEVSFKPKRSSLPTKAGTSAATQKRAKKKRKNKRKRR